jgi:hypothetical protein
VSWAAQNHGTTTEFRRPLKPDNSGMRNPPRSIRTEIESDHGEARTARDEIGSPEGRVDSTPTANPEEEAEVSSRRLGHSRIERTRRIDESDQIALRGGSGDQADEEATPPRGTRPDDLAEAPPGEGGQQRVDVQLSPVGGGRSSDRLRHDPDPAAAGAL